MYKTRYTWIKAQPSKRWIVLFSFLITLVLGYQTDRQMGFLSSDKGNINLVGDGTGYYAYLPQYFIYTKQTHYQFEASIEKKYPNKAFLSGIQHRDGLTYNKYYIGTAICQLPFFLITHGLTKIINDQDADGYSLPYRGSIALSALLFFCIGAIAFLSLFKAFGVPLKISIPLLLVVTFGTNLQFYTAYWSSYSHSYSFALICLFLLAAKKISLESSSKWLYVLSFSYLLILFIRPTNGLIIFMLPFFFPTNQQLLLRLKSLFMQQRVFLIVSILFFLLLLGIQIAIIKHETGSYGLYTYQGEGFRFWKNPPFYESLFGYNKGFFRYIPLFLLSIPCTFFLFTLNKRLSWGIVLTLSLLIYLTASWWITAYGWGVGMRPFIDFYGLFALPIGLAFMHLNTWFKSFSIVFIVLSIIVYRTYQKQVLKNILPYEGIYKEMYWNYFFKTADRFSWGYAIQDDRSLFNLKQREVIDQKMEAKEFHMQSNTPLVFSLHPRTNDQDSLFVRIKGKIWISKANSVPSLSLKGYGQKGVQWERVHYFGHTIEKVGQWSNFKAYFAITPSSLDSVTLALHPGSFPTKYKSIEIKSFHP